MIVTAMVALIAGCEPSIDEHPKQVIVLGFDGMDPKLCRAMMADGRLPSFSKLAEQGTFDELQTSTPPQSPVAWSNLITGADSGEHGVFDFVHRNPETAVPYSSAAIEEPPNPLPVLGHSMDSLEMLGYEIPFRTARLKTNRHAPAFWEHLTEAGIPAHIYRMPANYPPTPSNGAFFCCLSDMGTVDLVNSLGTFSYYTSDPNERLMRMKDGGGNLFPLHMNGDRAVAKFEGPENTFKKSTSRLHSRGGKNSTVRFTINRDPTEPVAAIEYGERTVVLREGEWSDWQPIEFEMIPRMLSLSGACRFYLKQVHPHLKLYVSPINFDPQVESWEIDQPSDWSVRVSDKVGRYYTQGLPEDTKALSNEVLTRDEFLAQAELVLQERMKLLSFAMEHYEGGLLFFYFGTTDQIGHMFWGARDADHPAVSAEEHAKYKNVMEGIYERMDDILGDVMIRYPDATLMVMSDHGFGSFRRKFAINSWLRDNGYAAMKNPFSATASLNFDFTKTRAYALGINALYINVKGREAQGIVSPAEKQALMDEIAAKLTAYRDPETGEQVVKALYQADKTYSGPKVADGPDMIVGYDSGYQGAGSLGEFPEEIITDNTDAWCGDHCVATDLVPGVIFSNRKLAIDDPSLVDIAPTIMGEFGLAPTPRMKGRNLFTRTVASR